MEGLHKENDPSRKLSLGLDPKLEYRRQKVIEMLKTDPLDLCLEAISRWSGEAEIWAEKGLSSRRRVIVNFAQYDFFLAVGEYEGAEECAMDALYIAKQEGYADLELYIESKIQ